MKLVFVFALVFTFVRSEWMGGKYVNWKQNSCLECTHVVNDVIDSLKKELEKDEPLPFDGGDPCNKCEFSGGSTMTQVGEACIIKAPWKPKCHIQAFTVKMEYLKMTCNCSLPTRPIPFIRVLKRAIKDGPKIVFCNLKDAGPPSNYSLMDHLIPKKISELVECHPWIMPADEPKEEITDAKSAAGSVLSGKKQKIETPEATDEDENGPAVIGANWPNIEARLYILKCPNKQPKLRKIHIIKNNYDDITSECKTEWPTVSNSCKCLAQTDFAKIKIVTAVRNVIPCLINSKEESLSKIVGELQCSTQSMKK